MKTWWTSFTHWFNAVGMLLIGSMEPLSQALPSLQPYVTSSTYRWAFLGLAVGNILIRQYRTKTALTPILGSSDAKPASS